MATEDDRGVDFADVDKQTAVTAYFLSKQLLLIAFALQYSSCHRAEKILGAAKEQHACVAWADVLSCKGDFSGVLFPREEQHLHVLIMPASSILNSSSYTRIYSPYSSLQHSVHSMYNGKLLKFAFGASCNWTRTSRIYIDRPAAELFNFCTFEFR